MCGVPSINTASYSPLAALCAQYFSTPKWHYAETRFRKMLTNLDATPSQVEDYRTKLEGLANCLNRHYWPYLPSGQHTFILTGSWEKGTQARVASDIDVLFLMPLDMQRRFESRVGNKQSQILHEIRSVLLPTYPTTVIKGDGPTVVVDFSTIKVEIAPVFLDIAGARQLGDPQFKVWVCDTNHGGRYKLAAPAAEAIQIHAANQQSGGNLMPLLRMAKTWKRYCNVPIKTIVLEQIAMQFLSQWENARNGYFWPDWLFRDFLAYMLTRVNGYALLPITGEIIAFGDAWVTRAETALRIANQACQYEEKSLNLLAGTEWQKIFGTMITREA